MKKIFLLFWVSILSQALFATHVDIATAVNTARNFYYSALNINAATKDIPEVVSTENYFSGNILTYYIVNFSNKGYVIVSSDDEFYPVIGYSDEANLNPADIPPAMRWWLDMQAAESEKSPDPQSAYSKSIRNAWEKLSNGNMNKSHSKTLVAPLLTSRWDQGSGYNYHCPEYPSGPGGRCYAGCVATTMAQIMYYHKYPEQGTGSHYYNHVHFGSLGANFEETTYDWAAMTNVLNANSMESISTLISHCGLSVNMNYSPLGSGASSSNVEEALKNHFGYSNRLKYLEKSDYYNDQWNQMIIDNLEMQLPVYYSGSGSAGGHAFVCDGVKDSCYFHFNWGWSGSANGYFYLSNLNSGNGNFSSAQAAVMNIAPYSYPYCLGQKQFTMESKTFIDGSNFSYYWNDTDCEWLIAPDTADHITLLFNSFATEKDHDILSIYKGDDATDSLIGQYSGHDIPPVITVTGNRLYLRFTTDGSGQDQGWTATYSTIYYTNITENDEVDKLNISPNPASDVITVGLPSENSEPLITFYNLTGEQFLLPFSGQNSKQLRVDVKDLAQGFYFIKIISNNKTYIGKVLIQH